MNTSATTAGSPATAANAPDDLAGRTRGLYRPTRDRMLAGVASGLARSLRVDVILVRIAFVVAVFVGGLGIPLYLACWLLIPDEPAVESIAGDFVSSVNTWRN
jgi:phage shock protein PspC (stress-responsive transcriptional regulator)